MVFGVLFLVFGKNHLHFKRLINKHKNGCPGTRFFS